MSDDDPTLARQLLRCMEERNAARGALMNAGAALHVAKREAEAAEAENARLREALLWCSGSDDFNEGGFAREGWLKLCAPLLKGDDHE